MMETQREMEQELEWIEAQKIGLSLDLVAAAKQQLRFLAAVDRNRWLYEAPALEKAIYRYNICWLPLLAKHSESPIFDGPLVVPLDCEWIWHCHRLNPVRYRSDCEELFGRILGYSNVVSSTKEVCGSQTQKIWNALYPDEPYDFNLERTSSDADTDRLSGFEKSTKYDLASAVKRQSPFFYQVSRPHMKNEIFLEEAVARYKGFLHLIKRNKERSVRQFCVPTYDIDLIWHTHQLHPVSYSKDLVEALGKILEHDDMDSDRTKGKKLDVGFSATVKQWEQTFGKRYRKAGAMYRGAAPSPHTAIPVEFLESGGCGSGCGSGCGNMVKSGGSCGSGCGGGCGNAITGGGSCGSGCGGGCGGCGGELAETTTNASEKAVTGGGSCGSGCGGGCGGCGGGLAETTTNASACGACGGSGCGGRSTNNIIVVEA